MYHFSRAIYRELAPLVTDEERDRRKQLILDACEYTIRRVVYERGSIGDPARFLFGEIRPHFRLGDQAKVWRIVDLNVGLALELIDRIPDSRRIEGSDLTTAA